MQALIEGVALRIESFGVGECAKLAKYLRNRAPGLALAQKSVLPRLEALAEPWSAQAVSLACLCWYLVRALHKRPARARYPDRVGILTQDGGTDRLSEGRQGGRFEKVEKNSLCQ